MLAAEPPLFIKNGISGVKKLIKLKEKNSCVFGSLENGLRLELERMRQTNTQEFVGSTNNYSFLERIFLHNWRLVDRATELVENSWKNTINEHLYIDDTLKNQIQKKGNRSNLELRALAIARIRDYTKII